MAASHIVFDYLFTLGRITDWTVSSRTPVLYDFQMTLPKYLVIWMAGAKKNEA
jgi:hypothetical protein